MQVENGSRDDAHRSELVLIKIGGHGRFANGKKFPCIRFAGLETREATFVKLREDGTFVGGRWPWRPEYYAERRVCEFLAAAL